LATAAAFAAFTPLHDGVHGSISRHRWINETAGRLGGMVLGGSFAAFRHAHLEHHRHTNEPGLDPDLWSGQGPKLQLPLRWLTQEARHYVVYLQGWGRRPLPERVDFLLTNGALAAAMAWSWRAGLGWEVLAFWFLPGRLASALLAFSFDYLPHQPHGIPASVDRYRATHVLTDPFLTPLFLYQNYHLIHHLHPGVPFYRYARIWRSRREELLSRGAREISF
jgi:fatty acid desaturase